MEKSIVSKVCAQVYNRTPEVRNAQPVITEQDEDHFLFVFSGTAFGANGKPIPRVVRVVTDGNGKIIKFSSSR